MICLILLFLLRSIKLIRKRNLFKRILLLKARNSKFLKRLPKRKKLGLERTQFLEIWLLGNYFVLWLSLMMKLDRISLLFSWLARLILFSKRKNLICGLNLMKLLVQAKGVEYLNLLRIVWPFLGLRKNLEDEMLDSFTFSLINLEVKDQNLLNKQD